MYYTIDAATKQVVEGGKVQRPPWLGVSVHLLNAVVAWTDLLVSDSRSFSARARTMSVVFVLGYSYWLFLLRYVSGSFPYPFMNALPFPSGYFFVVTAGLLLFLTLFYVGRWINSGIQRCMLYILGP